MSDDYPWATIPALTAAAAERFGDATAISDGEISISYADLFEASRRFGAALVERGIDRGDRVAIWSFNSAEWIISCLGLLQAGAVMIPINTRFKGREAAEILARSNARALVTVTDFLGADYVSMLDSSGVDLPQLKTIVIASGGVPDGSVHWSEFADHSSPEAIAEVDRRRNALTHDDVSDILFTSGTTGVPKGVVMTHGRSLYCGTDWATMTGLGPKDRYLQINPYFSQFGYKAGIIAAVTGGATMLPEPVFDVDRTLTRIQDEGVTVLPGPPTIYQSILDHPKLDQFDLSSLRVAVTGSADTPVELIRRMYEETPFSTIISGYGMTECGAATSTLPGDDFAAVANTVGRARPAYEVRIADAEGRDVPEGATGEILVRGPATMLHYLDDPGRTSATLLPEGWLRTQDLGSLDSDGRLHIDGRIKDIFIVGGFNVYPAEVENALLLHPDVSRAAVIGIPDRRLGEVGMAFVVLKPGSERASAQSITAWCRDQMANFRVPRVIEIVNELPLNSSGKVEKELLRQRAGSIPEQAI